MSAPPREQRYPTAGRSALLLLQNFEEALEEGGVKYAIRIPANDSLERGISESLTRPVGRASHGPLVRYKMEKTFVYKVVKEAIR